jgi:hypothetical protein
MPKLLLSLTSGVAWCLAASPAPWPAPVAAPHIRPTAAPLPALGCPWLYPACAEGVHRG